MKKEIINFTWRSGRDCVGIVLCRFEIEGETKYQAYIGVAKGGFSEDVDSQYIAEWGGRLTFEEMKPFFRDTIIEEKDYGVHF